MKASRVAIFAGMLLVAVFLAVQNAQLKSRIAGLESRAPLVVQESASAERQVASSPFHAPAASDSSGVNRRSIADRLPSPGSKVAQRIKESQQAKEGEIAEVEGAREKLDSKVATLSFALGSAEKQKIEHWTGGDKRNWGHEQAAGNPDTTAAGDIPSAWASKAPDGGEEWIKLDYDRFVELDKVSVVESHNPGAISKVVAVLSDGNEAVIWEGQMDPSPQDELVASDFPVTEDLRARSVKVYLDTARVPGWNEIDAVQLVGKDGSKQWASASSSSSSYADP
jgi:hypothetical protein